jgi:hypothetical protein
MPTEKDETLVVIAPITVSAPTENIDLAGGQELTKEDIERIGPSRMASMQRLRQVVPKSELKTQAETIAAGRPFPDVGVEEATVEQLDPEAAKAIRQQAASPSGLPPSGVTHASHAKTGLHAANPNAVSPEWHSTSVDDLDIDEGTRHALANNNLRTVGDIIAKGKQGQGLGEGIGDAREEHIQKAISKVQRKNK